MGFFGSAVARWTTFARILISTRTLVVSTIAIGALLPAADVYATPFTYNEAVDGSLPDGYSIGFMNNPPVFTLGTGQNTVSGQLSSFTDFDGFAFVVPQSTTLNSITLSFSQATAIGYPQYGISAAAGFGLTPGIGNAFSPAIHQEVNFGDASPQILFPSATPLGPGTYTIGDTYHSNFKGGYENYTYTLNVASLTPSPTPPTTLQLAEISRNVYSDAPASVDGYKVVASWLDPNRTGFYAFAYKKTDPITGDQIVIAFRGTDQLKDIFTDVAFGPSSVGGGLNALLPNHVTEATQFLRSVAFANQSATQITLTGHSLGGAIASMMGRYTGLSTETFNAPGAAEAYDRLAGTFAILGDGSQGIPGVRPSTILNDRVYGDQVSLLGTAQGPVYTYLPQIVAGDHGYNFGTAVLNATATTIGAEIRTLRYTHNMDNFAAWIKDASPVVHAGYSGPGLYAFIPGLCSGLLCRAIGLTAQVLADTLYLLDPPSANGYLFQVGSGPLFSSLTFMLYPQDPSYELFTWRENAWALAGIFAGGDIFQFGQSGADRFMIYGFDPLSGGTTVLPDDFFVGVSFLNSGLFDGTAYILSTNGESSVPEPPGALLALTSISVLITVRRRRACGTRSRRS